MRLLVDKLQRVCYYKIMELRDFSIGDLVRWYGCDPHGIVTESSLAIVVSQGSQKFAAELISPAVIDVLPDDAYISYIRDQYRVYLFDRKSLVWCHCTELMLISPKNDGSTNDEAQNSS